MKIITNLWFGSVILLMKSICNSLPTKFANSDVLFMFSNRLLELDLPSSVLLYPSWGSPLAHNSNLFVFANLSMELLFFSFMLMIWYYSISDLKHFLSSHFEMKGLGTLKLVFESEISSDLVTIIFLRQSILLIFGHVLA